MKKTILAVALLVATAVSAQDFYVSFGGGVYSGASKDLLTGGGEFEGSYGEGYHGQARLGYMLNEKFGVDLGVGYLYGDDQNVYKANGVDIIGRARAFGVSLAGLYNISDNVYVRAGLLSKLGGRTDIVSSVSAQVPATIANPAAPATATLPLEVAIERDNKGTFPLGFIGAFGVKFKIADRWSLFAEMEYQGIDVSADRSVLDNFSATIAGQPTDKATLQGAIGQQVAGLLQLAQIAPNDPRLAALPNLVTLRNLIADEVIYVDNPNPANAETRSFDAPYSSFGINIGATYSFDW